jgi:quinoprotein glucose dehydrogenase
MQSRFFCVGLSLVIALATVRAELPKVGLKPVWKGLKTTRPLWLETAPDGSGRLFCLEQGGSIIILPKDKDSAKPEREVFFDITKRKPWRENEEGLLGMAFHPRFKANGKLYVYYSQQDPKRSVVSEFTVAKSNPNRADMKSERVLLEFAQPYWNHNGGVILFGPDQKLYIASGDGGKANDPHDNAQNLSTMLGKIFRIDVDTRSGDLQYGIPADNPFAGRKDSTRGEIWAYGLRNIWRMSFDRETGDLWAADVGQNKWEEVNLIIKGGNYGWNIRESFHKFKEDSPAKGDWIDPVIEYAHHAGIEKECKFPGHGYGVSITGGYVYRGRAIPALRGAYIYGDFTTGLIFAVRQKDGKATEHGTIHQQKGIVYQIASFGEDADGELYLLPLVANPATKRDPAGNILQLVAE